MFRVLTIFILALIFSTDRPLVAQSVSIVTNSESIRLEIPAGHHRTCTVTVLPHDEIWMIDARESHCHPHDLGVLKVSQLIQGYWEKSDLSLLTTAHATDKSKQTMLYIHGNRTDEKWAKSRGLQLYDATFVKTADCRPAVRYIIMGWRSESERLRPIKEFTNKARRSVTIGCTLASVLNQFEDRQLMLTGFSLGSQSIITALNHPSIQNNTTGLPGQYHVTLIAPSLEGCYCCSLLAQYPNGDSVAQTDVFTNSVDRALKASQRIFERSCPVRRLDINRLANYNHLPLSNYRFMDLACSVGKKHSVARYTCSSEVQAGLNQMLHAISAVTVSQP